MNIPHRQWSPPTEGNSSTNDKWSPPSERNSSTNDTNRLSYLASSDNDRDPWVIVNRKDIKERSAVKIRMLGAGPVATWTAVHTKARNPNADIEMYEKRTEYVRNHTVNIDDSSFKSMDTFNHPVITPRLHQLRDIIQSNNGRIGCKVFESLLKDIALDTGVKVHAGDEYEAIAISEDKLRLKGGASGPVDIDYDVLVCADGAHSKARKALLKMHDNPTGPAGDNTAVSFAKLPSTDEESEFSNGYTLQYRVRVKYKVRGETQKLTHSWADLIKNGYATYKVMESPVDEHIGNLDANSQREVTLDFFITEAEYNSLKGYNLKTAAKLDTTGVAPSLIEKIETWQKIKTHCHKEVQIEGSEEITPYYLSFFHARKVQQVTANKKLILLAGDAKTSLPYWRSLNNGLITEAELAKHLAVATHENLRKIGEYHEKYANRHAKEEIRKAKLKDTAVNASNLFLRVSNVVPWQVNKWSASKLDKMKPKKTH